MTLQRIFGRDRPATHADSGHGNRAIRTGALAPAVALALAFSVLAVASCGSGGGASPGTSGEPGGTPVASDAPSTAQPPTNQDIPPGREISAGGGPVEYTFREEWRRGLAAAQAWRGGAYLISAAGDMINDEGVPSHWALSFIDKVDADAVLLVEIDPWGTVTQTREVTGDGVGSFVDQHTRRIPYEVIDSDTAVELGKAALAARLDLGRTKDPRMGLGFSTLDGSGPYWRYSLFDESAAEYVSAQVDALTGEVTPPE